MWRRAAAIALLLALLARCGGTDKGGDARAGVDAAAFEGPVTKKYTDTGPPPDWPPRRELGAGERNPGAADGSVRE
jgi:hypothetical protein